MAICGVLTHYLKHLIQAKREDSTITYISYWNENRPQALVSLIGTIALFVIMLEAEQMNSAVAYFCGFAGNSAADIIGRRVGRKHDELEI